MASKFEPYPTTKPASGDYLIIETNGAVKFLQYDAVEDIFTLPGYTGSYEPDVAYWLELG